MFPLRSRKSSFRSSAASIFFRNASPEFAPSSRSSPSAAASAALSPSVSAAFSSLRSLRVTTPTTCGFDGVMYMCRRPMVRNSRYARLKRASACTMKGCRCMNGLMSTRAALSCSVSVLTSSVMGGALNGICLSVSMSSDRSEARSNRSDFEVASRGGSISAETAPEDSGAETETRGDVPSFVDGLLSPLCKPSTPAWNEPSFRWNCRGPSGPSGH